VIIEEFFLSAEDIKMHRDELLPLYESFSSQDLDGSGDLEYNEVIGALLENGLLPHKAQERERLHYIVEKETQHGMNFKGFLGLIRIVREECLANRRLGLRRQFKRYDKDGSGELSLAEVSLLFIDMGLTPKCQEDQDEMKALLREVDADGSGELDFDEFQDLVQRITERLRFSQRRRENETAKQLGFNAQQVVELRESFFSLDQDGSGELSIDECRTTLTLLRKNMSAEDLNVLFETIDKDGNGRIDFQEFLHFMRSLSDQKIFERITTEGRLSFACMM
jgi:calmodulin